MDANLAMLRRKRVTVLPDAFVDALVPLPAWKKTLPRMRRVVRQGGGNIPVGPIEFKLGGNAANLAVALSRLGATVSLIARTDELGAFLLSRAARESGLNIEPVNVGDRASATLALEFEDANLMLSHAGPLRQFGPRSLSQAHWRLIEAADAVIVVNWSQNHQGTELLSAVAPRAHRAGAFVYVDTGDPRHRDAAARRALLREKGIWSNVDAWGLNENEARWFSGDRPGEILSRGRSLASEVGTRLDLHTRKWAASIHDEQVVKVDAFASKSRRLTGAGDAWNAGNLAGYLLDWDDATRLRFAHLVATKYVTGATGRPPTPRDLPGRVR